ncbi:hypothetical protein GE061_017321 [Apolygus lucorum]|uniref:Uncharacterized protein n=1 Tax=Apolygus lucorum TaxID=248454 RepID=A0A8S9XDE8_APOLU|nr:hypothetical protein GE061_017321 [Apolygus lucorum]
MKSITEMLRNNNEGVRETQGIQAQASGVPIDLKRFPMFMRERTRPQHKYTILRVPISLENALVITEEIIVRPEEPGEEANETVNKALAQ